MRTRPPSPVSADHERSGDDAAASDRVSVPPNDLTSRIESLCREFTGLWVATPAALPELGPPVGRRKRWANARAATHLIDAMADEIRRSWSDDSLRDFSRDDMRRRVERFGRERLDWPDGYGRLLAGDAFFDATVDFFREIRALDLDMPMDELWQALRNVWVANSLQMLLDRPVELTPALFAYSMLYPVTDNWLDDPDVPRARKRAFAERLGLRLSGYSVRPADGREAQACRLVQRIETDWPRAHFAHVYSSLLAIHTSQCRSLDQHEGNELTDTELLGISVAKGGTSVLADLVVILGDAEPAEMRFAFGYGVALQLLDDLQDLDADVAAGHETLFSRAARRGVADEPASRLAGFIDALLADGRFDGPAYRDRLDLIRRNCRALLVDSVAAHRSRFSRAFRSQLARQWPFSFRAQRKLSRRTVRLTNEAAAALQLQSSCPIDREQPAATQSGRACAPAW